MPRFDRDSPSWRSRELTTISSPPALAMPHDAILRLTLAAHLARYKGQSRDHVLSDLRSFLTWCQQRHLGPLAATRPQIELYVRWMQEVQHYKPSTVSRRLSVLVGVYRTCVIDHILEHSPADYVRRCRPSPTRRPDRRTPRRPTNHDARRTSSQEPRPAPERHPGRLPGLGDLNVGHNRAAHPLAQRLLDPSANARRDLPHLAVSLGNELGATSRSIRGDCAVRAWRPQAASTHAPRRCGSIRGPIVVTRTKRTETG
jgi:hypothetical protein